jgi:hypothetical protein
MSDDEAIEIAAMNFRNNAMQLSEIGQYAQSFSAEF